MAYNNRSDFDNDTSFTFFGPIDMAFRANGSAFEEEVSIKLTLSCTLFILMAISIVGNVCTCAVIARDKTMRTPTNCYLFNLAVSDLLMALFIPLEIYFFWVPHMYPFGEVGCRVHIFLWDCVSNCSVLTICAFTVERYLVVAKPFLRQKLTKKSRVFKIIACNWVISVSLATSSTFYLDLLEHKKYVYCYFTLTDMVVVFMVVDLILFFVIPMTIITVLYVMIALKLSETHNKMRRSPIYGKQNRDKAVKMLAAVAGLFFLCWAPYAAFRVLMISSQYDEYYNVWRITYYLCAVNVYLSTSANPILYSLMSHKFRTAFKEFLKGSNTRQRSQTGNNTKCSYASTIRGYNETQLNGIPNT